jgi:hypothetical protein
MISSGVRASSNGSAAQWRVISSSVRQGTSLFPGFHAIEPLTQGRQDYRR